MKLVPVLPGEDGFCTVQGCSCLADWSVKGTAAKLCGHHKAEDGDVFT